MNGKPPARPAPLTALVPVYRPGPRLLTLITDLRRDVPEFDVVVVDDGSGRAAAAVLGAARGLGATVLRHDTNRGKGVALKTGFRHIAATWPGRDVVCADADGQHSVTDIVRVAALVRDTGRMALGVRRFDGTVPLRSKVGNALTRLIFRAATGRPVEDTQTGLRAYPAALLEWLGTVPGQRFEYEMNVLLEAARKGLPMEQVTVDTRYPSDGGSSHFGSLADSARVYLPLLRFVASSLVASPPGKR